MLQACLNGARSRDFHAAVPLTAADLARDVRDCVAAGAEEVHIHPRGEEGRETFDAATVADTLQVVREMAPGILIGLSTRVGIVEDPASRAEAFASWTELPDYVSVNFSEVDAPQVVRQFLVRGVGVEAGLATVADAERFVGMAEATSCLRVLIEIEEQEVGAAKRVAQDIIAVLDSAGVDIPRQLHGYDDTQWPLYEMALKLGLDQRIGLEDGNLLPDGRLARGNAEMISAAIALAKGKAKAATP